jgi:formylglycine-generating enzyme required for sulfatase activity
MDYIPGENLLDVVKRRGALPEAEIVPCICQIGEALTVVHQAGLVHRDAHPGNIMLRSNGKAVLIDFGIAAELVPTTVSSKHFANVGFAPYEQMKGDRKPTVDVYCIAATLYYAVTGQKPPTSLDRKLYNTRLTPPKQIIPSISDKLNQAILKGMALEAKDRPQTMSTWIKLLEASQVITQLPIQRKQLPINRKQFLKWAGLGGLGLVTAVVARGIFDSESTSPLTSPKSTPLPSSKSISLQSFQFEVVTLDSQGKITNRRLSQANKFTEDLGNGVTLEMVKIPNGSFKMGSPSGEKSRYENEGPQHTVNVPAFFMGRFAVTQEQYQQVMGNNPSYFKGVKRPVERVSWKNAVEFCKDLSQKTGREYRLPSEAEWEYACRAGTTTPFHFGETITTELANYDGNNTYASAPKGKYRQQTTDVGSFPPNAFGLCDMHGNVWEWCQDAYHYDYNGAPTNGSAWIDNDNDYRLLLRGGSWLDLPAICRSANRLRNSPDHVDVHLGFRVVCGGASRTL